MEILSSDILPGMHKRYHATTHRMWQQANVSHFMYYQGSAPTIPKKISDPNGNPM